MHIRLWASLLLLLSMQARAGTGDLDPTFGTGGIVEIPFTVPMSAIAMLPDPQGRLVVVGTAEDGPIAGTSGANGAVIVRLTPGGSLDATFGNGGLVRFDPPGFLYANVSAALRQADGKLVMGGFAEPNIFTAGWVLRCDDEGTLDTSFGSGGVVTLGQGVFSLALQADGRILVGAGGLARLSTDGSLDLSFGTAGYGTPLPAGVAGGRLLVQADGRILQAGSVLGRYLPDGTADVAFGTGGVVSLPVGTFLSDLAEQLDGKILVGGSNDGVEVSIPATPVWNVARYDSTGQPDPSFGTNGIATYPVGYFDVVTGGYLSFLSTIVPEASGDILLLGDTRWPTPAQDVFGLAVARLDSAGALDFRFGSGGLTTVPLPDGAGFLGRTAMVSDGKLLVLGEMRGRFLGGLLGLALGRFDADCPAAPDADGDGTGDACDPCTSGVSISKGRLQAIHLLAPSGRVLTISGTMSLPPPPTDLVASGARLLLRRADGVLLADLPLLPMPADPSRRVGWSANAKRTAFRFQTHDFSPRLDGVVDATVRSNPVGVTRFRMKLTNGDARLMPNVLPLEVTIVLSSERASTGRCATGVLPSSSGACKFAPDGSHVTCR